MERNLPCSDRAHGHGAHPGRDASTGPRAGLAGQGVGGSVVRAGCPAPRGGAERARSPRCSIDLDAFAAVEQRDKLFLRGKPVVCRVWRPGRRRHGVVRRPQVLACVGRCRPRRPLPLHAALPHRPLPRLPRHQPGGRGRRRARCRRWSSRPPSTRRLSTSRRPHPGLADADTRTVFAGVRRARVAQVTGADRLRRARQREVDRQGRQRPRTSPTPWSSASGSPSGTCSATHVTVIPASARRPRERPAPAGIHTVADLEPSEDGARQAGRQGPRRRPLPAARAQGHRPVAGEREASRLHAEAPTTRTSPTGSGSLEGPAHPAGQRRRQRLRKSGLSGRTVTIRSRLHDFTTLSCFSTLPSPRAPRRSGAWPRAAGRPDTSCGAPPRGRRLRARGTGIERAACPGEADGTTQAPATRSRSRLTSAARRGPRLGRRAHRRRLLLGVGLGRGAATFASKTAEDAAGLGALLDAVDDRRHAAVAVCAPFRRRIRRAGFHLTGGNVWGAGCPVGPETGEGLLAGNEGARSPSV